MTVSPGFTMSPGATTTLCTTRPACSADAPTLTSIFIASNMIKTSPALITSPFCALILYMLACMCAWIFRESSAAQSIL